MNSYSMRIAVCAGAVGVAWVATEWIAALRTASPSMLFVAATAFVTWWCGWKCGLVSIGASIVLFCYSFVPPFGSLRVESGMGIRVGAFAFTSWLVWFAVSAKSDSEKEHQRDRRWLEKIIRRTTDGVIAADASGQILYLNPAGAELTGWKPEEGKGRPLWEVFRVLDPVTHTSTEPKAARLLRQEFADTRTGRRVLSTRDGEEVPIVETSSPIFLDDGTLDGVVVVFRRDGNRAAA